MKSLLFFTLLFFLLISCTPDPCECVKNDALEGKKELDQELWTKCREHEDSLTPYKHSLWDREKLNCKDINTNK